MEQELRREGLGQKESEGREREQALSQGLILRRRHAIVPGSPR